MRHSDYYVYVLFRETGVPFYVGKGRKDRWLHHERDGVKPAKERHRDRVVRKVLATRCDLPKIKVREGLDEQVAYQVEAALVAALGRWPDGPLVNRTAGGEGVPDPSGEVRARMQAAALGRRYSDEHKAKLSVMRKGINAGIPLSAETRAKLSAAHKGKKRSAEHIANSAAAHRGIKLGPLSSEHKQKLSAAHAGRVQPPAVVAKRAASNTGKRRTQETKDKIAAALLGRKRSPEYCREQSARTAEWWCRHRAKAGDAQPDEIPQADCPGRIWTT